MRTIGKILPIEGYYVQLKGNPPINYAISLTHLYQPLIGIEAITLYQTLFHEIYIQTHNSLQTHHTLMNYLNMPLDDLYEARLKLEGIGLLKTYENTHHQEKSYTYVLQSPFSPQEFFNDPMLSELLYHHIGKDKFNSLKKIFQKKNDHSQGNNVTASFNDVFQTFQPTFDHELSKTSNTPESDAESYHVDFTWIETMLKRRMIPVKKILTIKNKKLISDMMFLYDLTTYEIEKSLLWSLTEENSLDQEEFKVACHDIFKTKNHNKPIKLIVNSQSSHQKETDQPKTKEEMLIQRLETISPKQLLEDLSSGNQASEQDMKIIREVMTNQGLPVPVMNVLIHYVLLQSNMKLSRAYLEKIASHWSRANLKTAKEAMAFARKEIATYQKTSAKRSTYRRKQQSNEVIPDWFKNRNKQESQSKKEQKSPQAKKEREELATLIQQFAEE